MSHTASECVEPLRCGAARGAPQRWHKTRNLKRQSEETTMLHKRHKEATALKTTLGELTAAYYDAALAELKNEKLAARVAEKMVREALLKLQR